MDTEKLHQALYDKMAAEQKEYHSWLLGQPPEEILNHTYEYTIREDIMMTMDWLTLPEKQAAALLESPSPLADIFKDFRDMETGHMDYVRECIEGRAESLLEVQREATRSIPLYPQSGEYAREHGELDAFRASRQANVACRDAIETAIREGFDGRHLSDDAAKDVLTEFGPERVSYVLAATLQDKTWDQRISSSNQAWAATVPMFETQDRRRAYAINSHPYVLDGFVSQARKEMVRETERQDQRKPSIKAQLTAKAAQAEKPAAQRHQNSKEAR